MRYLMTFAYDGTLFKGYQKQKNDRTIQGELEKGLTTINGKTVKLVASGRTDAGVHAFNQKAHFDLDINISIDGLKKAINSLISNEIYVKQIEEVADDFHARFAVKRKQYVYLMNCGEYNPFQRNYFYQYNRPLDIEEIKKAFKYLVGEHDYKSFAKTDNEKEDYVRKIFDISLIVDGDKLEFSFIGSGFFRYMVRNMVGTLIEIGEGKKKSEDIIEILEALDRRKAGKTANPEGLYLKNVMY